MHRSAEDQFEADLRWTAARIRNLLGRRPLIYYRLIADHGGVGAAKRLLRETGFREWFARLLQEERLDLSIEAHVVRAKYQHLFSELELRVAEERLMIGGLVRRDWEPVERRAWCRIVGPSRRRRTPRGLSGMVRRRRSRLRWTTQVPLSVVPLPSRGGYPVVASAVAAASPQATRRGRTRVEQVGRRRPDRFSVRRWRGGAS